MSKDALNELTNMISTNANSQDIATKNISMEDIIEIINFYTKLMSKDPFDTIKIPEYLKKIVDSEDISKLNEDEMKLLQWDLERVRFSQNNLITPKKLTQKHEDVLLKKEIKSIPTPGINYKISEKIEKNGIIKTPSLEDMLVFIGTENTDKLNEIKKIEKEGVKYLVKNIIEPFKENLNKKEISSLKKAFDIEIKNKRKKIKKEFSEGLISFLDGLENYSVNEEDLFDKLGFCYLVNTSFNSHLKGKRDKNLWNKIRKNLNYLSTELVEKDKTLSRKFAEDLNDSLLYSKIARKEMEEKDFHSAYKDFVQTLVWALDERGNKNTMPLEYFTKKYWLPKARKKLIEKKGFSLLSNVLTIQYLINKETTTNEDKFEDLKEKLSKNNFFISYKKTSDPKDNEINDVYVIIDKQLINEGIEWILEQDDDILEKNKESLNQSINNLYREGLTGMILKKIEEKTKIRDHSTNQIILLNSLENILKENTKNQNTKNSIREINKLKKTIKEGLILENNFNSLYDKFISGYDISEEIESIIEKNSMDYIVSTLNLLNSFEKNAYLDNGGKIEKLKNYKIKILEKLTNNYSRNPEKYLKSINKIFLPQNIRSMVEDPINAYYENLSK